MAIHRIVTPEPYESPHKMPTTCGDYSYPISGAHNTWYQHRERYATAPLGEEGDYAREVHMKHMLNSVSMTNPPVNRISLNPPSKPARERVPGSGRVPAVILTVYVVAIVACYMLALVGWLA
jgi:hypothetical protein